jgi:hypothetical protein
MNLFFIFKAKQLLFQAEFLDIFEQKKMVLGDSHRATFAVQPWSKKVGVTKCDHTAADAGTGLENLYIEARFLKFIASTQARAASSDYYDLPRVRRDSS